MLKAGEKFNSQFMIDAFFPEIIEKFKSVSQKNAKMAFLSIWMF